MTTALDLCCFPNKPASIGEFSFFQIAENKAKRQQNSMSETERRLNSKLMQSVEKHEGGQLIAAAK